MGRRQSTSHGGPTARTRSGEQSPANRWTNCYPAGVTQSYGCTRQTRVLTRDQDGARKSVLAPPRHGAEAPLRWRILVPPGAYFQFGRTTHGPEWLHCHDLIAWWGSSDGGDVWGLAAAIPSPSLPTAAAEVRFLGLGLGLEIPEVLYMRYGRSPCGLAGNRIPRSLRRSSAIGDEVVAGETERWAHKSVRVSQGAYADREADPLTPPVSAEAATGLARTEGSWWRWAEWGEFGPCAVLFIFFYIHPFLFQFSPLIFTCQIQIWLWFVFF
jgi:hypothetical protein